MSRHLSSSKRDPTSPLQSEEAKKTKSWSSIVSSSPATNISSVTEEPVMAEISNQPTVSNIDLNVSTDLTPAPCASTTVSLDIRSIEAISQMVICHMEPRINDIVKSSVNEALAPIRSQFQSLTEDNAELVKLNVILKSKVKHLESEVDGLEQYSRRNCIRISGVPEFASENTDEIILDIAKEMSADVSLADIDRSHRIGRSAGGRPRHILAKFTSYRARDKFYNIRKDMKYKPKLKNIFLNEDLTYTRSQILYEARQAVRNKDIIGAWSSDGNMFIRDNHNIRRKITTLGDLDQVIKQKHPTT